MKSFGRRNRRIRVRGSAEMRVQNWQTVGSVCAVAMILYLHFHLVVGSSRFRVGGSIESEATKAGHEGAPHQGAPKAKPRL